MAVAQVTVRVVNKVKAAYWILTMPRGALAVHHVSLRWQETVLGFFAEDPTDRSVSPFLRFECYNCEHYNEKNTHGTGYYQSF